MSDAGSEAENQEQGPSIGTYEGDRAATGERHGKGRNTFPNGDVYEGDYVAGKRHGKGIYTWKKPKARYVGSYENNLRNGEGAMVFPDGGRYKGEWANGKRQGKGLYVYPNADWYEGEWFEDMKHGSGVYGIVATQSKITGKWENNFLNGPAVIAHQDHEVRGNFKHIKKQVPVNPDDESQGTKEVIVEGRLQLPCDLYFYKSGHLMKDCNQPELVGLGPRSAAPEDEGAGLEK